MLQHFAFLGDFHPVAVHFPIALLPTVLLLRLYGWRRPRPWIEPTSSALLLLTCAATAIAIVLGLTARTVQGRSGALVDQHALLAFATLGALLLTTALQLRGAAIAGWIAAHRGALALPLRLLAATIRGLWRLLRGLLRVLLWPLRVVLWPLRAAYRAGLQARLQPRLDAGAQALRHAGAAGARRLRTSASGLGTAPAWTQASLAASFALVLLTGLKGATLSHGEGHLTRNLPPALAAVFGAEDALAGNGGLDRAFFDARVAPLLRRSCVKCHGSDKQRAGLRLDSYEAVIASRAVRWQDPWGSELMRRLLLPRDSAAAMPPPGKGREVHADDLGTLVAWLQGHTLETLAGGDGGLPSELRALATALTPIEDETLTTLGGIEGVGVRRYVRDYDLLTVTLSHAPDDRLAAALAALAPYADHVLELAFEGRSLGAAERAAIAGMRNLRTLNLSRSEVDDGDLQWLSGLRQLRWLNLYGTAVTADAAALRGAMPGIDTLYLPEASVAAGRGG